MSEPTNRTGIEALEALHEAIATARAGHVCTLTTVDGRIVPDLSVSHWAFVAGVSFETLHSLPGVTTHEVAVLGCFDRGLVEIDGDMWVVMADETGSILMAAHEYPNTAP